MSHNIIIIGLANIVYIASLSQHPDRKQHVHNFVMAFYLSLYININYNDDTCIQINFILLIIGIHVRMILIVERIIQITTDYLDWQVLVQLRNCLGLAWKNAKLCSELAQCTGKFWMTSVPSLSTGICLDKSILSSNSATHTAPVTIYMLQSAYNVVENGPQQSPIQCKNPIQISVLSPVHSPV